MEPKPSPAVPALPCLPVLAGLISLQLALSAAPAAPVDEPSWPGWRGPQRDARIDSFVPPETWPENLERVWRVEVGEGYATPLIVGKRIYQHARQGDEEVVWCLDRETGKPIWRRTVPVGFTPGRGGERHGLGPKSTPATADGRLFTLSITGRLSAWSADDGKPLWQRDFRERFELAHPYWGTATSPVVEDGRLYVHTGSCENGALFCIAPETGKDLWVRDEDANCYSSPIIETFEGVRQFVEFNHGGLCGIDLMTGKLLWRHPFPHHGNNQNTPTPVRHEDLLIVGAENRGVLAVRPQLKDGTWTVREVWRHRDVSMDMSSMVVCEGLVYGFSPPRMGRPFCLEPATGKVVWEGEARAGDNAQFLAIPGHVLALTDRGALHVLRANPQSCDILITYQVAEDGTWTAPALVGDALFTKDLKHLTQWRMPTRQADPIPADEADKTADAAALAP